MILNQSVLLLNQSYEPIRLISVQRAICLIFRKTVYVEQKSETEFVNSPKESWNAPSVVRLRRYVNIQGNRESSSRKRSKIYTRDKRRCSYCNAKCTDETITIDHVIPRSRGGENTRQNLVTCCITCNTHKKDRTPEEAGMKLLHTPTKLGLGLDKHVLMDYGEKNPSWKKYLYMEETSTGDSKFTHTE